MIQPRSTVGARQARPGETRGADDRTLPPADGLSGVALLANGLAHRRQPPVAEPARHHDRVPPRLHPVLRSGLTDDRVTSCELGGFNGFRVCAGDAAAATAAAGGQERGRHPLLGGVQRHPQLAVHHGGQGVVGLPIVQNLPTVPRHPPALHAGQDEDRHDDRPEEAPLLQVNSTYWIGLTTST